ncbi:transcription termination factor MTEF1, chloroplastic isoform X2 [Carica papaya]|uniref:transcription termination factor MTEF1, chloroplastic isoform X2 n=1 Tax=Carica papaya TaxID=3649 RepID=UPI000B8CCFA7|nr:transcription termination factor MTEF1, chloroplastic isoform X2 [Carica papaya]
MQDTLPFLPKNPSFPPLFSHHQSKQAHDFPSLSRPRNLHFPLFSSLTNTSTTATITNAVILLPPVHPRTPEIPTVSSPPSDITTAAIDPEAEFQEKMLYLDSIGIDFFSLINDHPPIISAALGNIKSTVDYLTSMDFTALELRRIVSMCPELLTSSLSSIVPVFTFLLREARVEGSDLKRVINRRPRLLACSVKYRLRPTMYFLQSIGISEVHKHTSLLSCSVENKLVPRIEFFEKIGFSHREAISMFRRFPQLFNYSIKDNYELKINYFVVEMGRDLKEIKEFPQYFSFSLENRIKPRHQCCVEKGVCFPLPVLLKTNEAQFRHRLERTLVGYHDHLQDCHRV